MLIDFNAAPPPPRLTLPVGVGIGKTTTMQREVTALLRSGALGRRKVVIGVPRHDLAEEQQHAFQRLGVTACVWKGRSAPDPSPTDPDRLMCLDPSAPFDALEVERVVETTSCKVTRDGVTHICPLYGSCGYQAQKPPLRAAEVVLTAHDTLFHQAPRELGGVGLLVLDEGFWTAGLRGTDGKAMLTLDGLRPHLGTALCWRRNNREDWEATTDLMASRERLWKVLGTAGNGPLSVAALRATGLTAEACHQASGLEHRRLRDPGLRPGMDPGERRRRIAAVLPKEGEPWAPPNRAAAMWLLIAEALENDHDVAGAVLLDAMTENGTVRSLRLAWRAALRKGWGAGGPILHLDATLRPELVTPFIPDASFAEPLMATEPHVHVRQILGAPTSAKALTPAAEAPARERKAAATHLSELAALIALRAAKLRRRSAAPPDLLVIGQKAAVDALRARGLPRNTTAVHFNALSGIDRWRDVAGLMVLGRTLPAPTTVEALAAAVTNRPPLPSRGKVEWWYENVGRRIALADGGVHETDGAAHADPTAEAIRWSICEGELIQGIGRGRGVNRTAGTPLEVDLLTDVVLPVVVHEVLAWEEVRPSRHDMMVAAGVELENATDIARCFPDIWDSPEAVRQQKARSVAFSYYRNLYESSTSRSSSILTYRPTGPGQKDRQARFDLGLIPDPRAWLERRLGSLVHFEITGGILGPATSDTALTADDSPPGTVVAAPGGSQEASVSERLATDRARLAAIGARLDAAMAGRRAADRARLDARGHRPDAAVHRRLAADRARLAALSARLDAAAPTTVAA